MDKLPWPQREFGVEDLGGMAGVGFQVLSSDGSGFKVQKTISTHKFGLSVGILGCWGWLGVSQAVVNAVIRVISAILSRMAES